MMRMRALTAILIMALLIVTLSPCSAKPPDARMKIMNQIEEADRLLGAGRVAEALEAFGAILDKYPQSDDAFWGYVSAARKLERHEELIELLEARLAESSGPEPRVRRVLGESYFKSGQKQQAIDMWKSIVDPSDTDSHAEVGSILSRHGLYPDAIEIYLAGRERAASDWLFARELASIYEAEGNYSDAVREYTGVLEDSEAQLPWVTNKLTIMLDSGADEDEIIGELADVIEQNPSRSEFHKLMGHVLLFLERPDEALESFMRVESLEKTDGLVLLDFATECTELGLFAPAEEALRLLISERSDSELAPSAQLQLAEILHKKGDHARAADAFADLARASGARDIGARSLIRSSEILIHDLGQPSDALEMLTDFEKTYLKSKHVFTVRTLRAEALVMMDSLDDALAELERALNGARNKEHEDLANYRTGVIHFYKHDFEDALTVLRDKIAADPSSVLSNDALELALIINRAGKDREALALYADAILLRDQRNYAESAATLEAMAEQFPLSSVTDEGLILLAEAKLVMGDAQGALAVLERVSFEFPDSHLAPVAIDKSADILAAHVGDRDGALDKYMEVLSRYPRSYLVEEVRRKILALRS